MKTILLYIKNLFCPYCGARHIDREEWGKRPHRTHLCEECGEEFDATVVGVEK